MWRSYVVLIGVFGVLIVLSTSCKDGGMAGTRPVQEIKWARPPGFMAWEQTTDGFFGVTTKHILDIWEWDGATLKRKPGVQLPDVLDLVPLPGSTYLTCVSPGSDYDPWPLVLASLPSNDVIKKWDPPEGWGYTHTGVSRNGKYAAVTLQEEAGWPDYQFRVGILDIASKEMRWVAELSGHGAGTIRRVVVSDDGKYIAIAGWNNGVALVDASLEKVLWTDRPAGANGLGYAAFSPDGSTLYASDAGGGGIYALETKTGKVVRQWHTTAMRTSCLALSADGSWIAAGTGLRGLVFLFNTASASGSKPTILPHGFGTTLIVSFSPDSQHLASVAGSRVKIWRVKP